MLWLGFEAKSVELEAQRAKGADPEDLKADCVLINPHFRGQR